MGVLSNNLHQYR